MQFQNFNFRNNQEDHKIQYNHSLKGTNDLDFSIPLSEHCPIDNGTLFKYLKYLKNNEEYIFVYLSCNMLNYDSLYELKTIKYP